MKFLVAMSIAAFAASAYAAPPVAGQSQASQFACDLGGDCGAGSDTAQPATAATPHGTPRGADVRGFTFKRTSPTPTTGAALSAPAPAPVATAAARPAPAPVAKGAANLQLDFASGSSELDNADRQRLGALASALGSPRLVGRRLRIEGHTDAKGSAYRNRDLSRRRAQSVADYLVATGVDRGRLEVVGYGAEHPLAGHAATDGANRRVMAVMLN